MGFLTSNDDWGFNTQNFLKHDDMRKYMFPWYKKIVEAAHRNGKPVDGHAPGLMGEQRLKYARSGIGTDHERVRCHMPLRRSMLTGHVAGP